MIRTNHFHSILQAFRDAVPGVTSGILVVVLVSCAFFGIQTYFHFRPGLFSVGASVFASGQLHRLLTYPFYHRSLVQLLLSVAALVLLSGSLERGVGTVRFLVLFLLLSATTGVFYAFVDLLLAEGRQSHADGLVPVALACVAVTTMHTKMTRGFLCGVSFPTVALPCVFLIITSALIPHSVLPCNIMAVLVGWTHGKGWFSLLNMSEARAGIVEKTPPFRLLRSVSAAAFVPASAEERRKALLPQINPTPGSYPVQAYAPLSSVNAADTVAKMYEGWPDSVGAVFTPPLHDPRGHGFGTSHGHFVEQSFSQNCNHNHFTHSHGHSHGHSHL